MKAKLANWS